MIFFVLFINMYKAKLALRRIFDKEEVNLLLGGLCNFDLLKFASIAELFDNDYWNNPIYDRYHLVYSILESMAFHLRKYIINNYKHIYFNGEDAEIVESVISDIVDKLPEYKIVYRIERIFNSYELSIVSVRYNRRNIIKTYTNDSSSRFYSRIFCPDIMNLLLEYVG